VEFDIIDALQTEPAVNVARSHNATNNPGRPFRIILFGLAFGALWFELCHALATEWSLNGHYNFGWFVPFFAAYLFWLRWQDRPGIEAGRSGLGDGGRKKIQKGESGKSEGRAPSGPKSRTASIRHAQGSPPSLQIAIPIIVLATFALLLLLPIRLFDVANPDWRPLGWLHAIVVVTVTLFALWWIGGMRWLRHFAFPVAFIFVAVPWISAIETPIVQGLMRIIAAAAAETVSLFGVPAQVQGNVVRLPSGVVGVNEACSGVRSLQTSLMIGLLFGELKRLSIGRRVLLVAIAVAIALAANCLRALLLVSIAAEENLAAVGKWHDPAGYAIVLLVCVGVIAIATQFGKAESRKRGGRASVPSKNMDETELVPPNERPHFSFPISVLSFFLLWLVTVEVGVESWYRIHERRMQPTPRWTIAWPQNAPGFRDLPIDEGVHATLRYDQGREVMWNATSGLRCFVFFFRWNPGGASVVRARAHRPDICLPSAGWRMLGDGETRTYRVNSELTLPFRRVDFASGNGTAIAHTFFCLQEDRQTTETRPDLALPPGMQPDWSLPARWRVVQDGVRNMGQQVIELVLVSTKPSSAESAEEEFVRILPEIIQRK
jgi:eight transmembrane protein EpsH (proposed exosortase)